VECFVGIWHVDFACACALYLDLSSLMFLCFCLTIPSDLFGKRVVENKDRRISRICVKKKPAQLVDTEQMSRFQ
jgi:hypothetical protein